EERLRIGESKGARGLGIRRDKAFAQLGQDHLKRLTEAVQYADAVLERNDTVGGVRGTLHAFGEGESSLRVVRMHQEGGAPRNVGVKHAHALIGRIPTLHHDVVQLIAQKLVDDALILSLDLEEVRERSHRRNAAAL